MPLCAQMAMAWRYRNEGPLSARTRDSPPAVRHGAARHGQAAPLPIACAARGDGRVIARRASPCPGAGEAVAPQPC